MNRSTSSDSSTTSSPSLIRKRLFARVPNPLSSNAKPGPLLDTNPPPAVQPSHNKRTKSLRAIKTKIQAASTPLKILRRLSNSDGRDEPHIAQDDMPPLSKVKPRRGRGRSYSLQLGRPPSLAWSRSAPDASISQSSISQTLPMSDGASLTSATDSHAASTLFQDAEVPIDLQTGVVMTKVSAKESKKVTVRIDADLGQIFYQSRRARISESLPSFNTLLSHILPIDLFSPPISCSTVAT